MSTLSPLSKWPTRMLFAACAAVGVAAMAAIEEQADLAYLAGAGAGGGGGEPFLAPMNVGRQKRGAKTIEARDGRPSTGCPNLLVRHDDKLLLFRDDTLVARFASLEDYQAYAKEQQDRETERDNEAAELAKRDGSSSSSGRKRPRAKGCPVLYVEPEPDARGQRRWRRRDAHQRARDRGTVRGLSAAFWDWQHLGAKPTDRPLAAVVPTEPAPVPRDLAGLKPYNEHHMDSWLRPDLVEAAERKREKMGDVSDNPMDPHWGGVRFSQQAIDSGKYDGHTIFRPAVA